MRSWNLWPGTSYAPAFRTLYLTSGVFYGNGPAPILRHELGHVLGLRHEHMRPEAVLPDAHKCSKERDKAEEDEWRAVTSYDSSSTMHYPHCGGTNDWNFALSDADRAGIQALYGAPAAPVVTVSVQRTAQYPQVDVEAEHTQLYGPFSVESGSTFVAKISGAVGDADLYVRLGAEATVNAFDCRPYIGGSDERCELDVGEHKQAWVMVRGYFSSTYTLDVQWTEALVNQVDSFVDEAVLRGQERHFGPFSAHEGTTFAASISGTGDADLYVQYGHAPGTSDYACRPYAPGSQEHCEVDISADSGPVYVMVRGYAAAEFTLNVERMTALSH